MTSRHDFGSIVDIDTKALAEGEDCWTITGYGSIFNNTDLGNDVVMPGAFAKSLRETGLPLLLFNHKMEDAPIGTIVEAKEDRRGLWFKAELPKDDSFVAGRIVPQLKRRGLRGTSIGYKATQKETRRTDGARLLKEIRLFEISVVNLPMNPLAAVETVKGLVPYQDIPVAREIAAWDAAAAFKRLRDRFGDDEDLRRAFLYADPDKAPDDWNLKLLIADVADGDNSLCVNRNALYKSVASICAGARSGVDLPEEAESAVRDNLDRYYRAMDLESPWKSVSVSEWKALDAGEREARLRGLGVTRDLAKALAATQLGGPREADRSKGQREAGREDATQLLTALISHLSEAAAAINARPGQSNP